MILKAFLIAGFILFLIRFLFGGPEDTWLCVGRDWVKHGNPKEPRPQGECRQTTPELEPGRDEHGCNATLDYSWCEVKKKCLRLTEEKCE